MNGPDEPSPMTQLARLIVFVSSIMAVSARLAVTGSIT
jgi:hypothetical protein